MIGKLPLNSDYAAYQMRVLLESWTYRFKVWWDVRLEGWYLSIGTLTEWYVNGERIRSGTQIFKDKKAEMMPPGKFNVIDKENPFESPVDPGRDDLGTRVVIIYVSDDDIEGLWEDDAEVLTVVAIP